MLLRDLLTEARERNRKKQRVATNRRYYNTRREFGIEGTDTQIQQFLHEVSLLRVDSDIQIEVV